MSTADALAEARSEVTLGKLRLWEKILTIILIEFAAPPAAVILCVRRRRCGKGYSPGNRRRGWVWNYAKNADNVSMNLHECWMKKMNSQVETLSQQLMSDDSAMAHSLAEVTREKLRSWRKDLWHNIWYWSSLNSQDQSAPLGEPVASTSFARCPKIAIID